MPIRKNQLSVAEQIKFERLSKADKARVLNCKNTNEALSLLDKMKESVRLEIGSYEPMLQVSGSAVKYKTKNLFNEVFDEQDVRDFMALAEMSTMMEDEVIFGELRRKINSMHKDGKQPLQCLVYSTKQNEKSFYNSEKKVNVWAQVIAETVNSNTEYALSINHMLVNWGMWKYQIIMLIIACGYMKQNEKLDEVIRDLYIDYDDDRVRYNVFKRLLYGLNKENYQHAFTMLKNVDFTESYTDRRYLNILKNKVENANAEERDFLYAAFRGTQGFTGKKRKRIEELFAKDESKIAKRINESNSEQKDSILEMVRGKVYGSQKDYREITSQAKDIRQYCTEIQKIFMEKLEKTDASLEDIKRGCLAIGNLDTDGRAIPFIEEQMSLYNDEQKNIIFSYVLAVLSDQYIGKFISTILSYDGNRVQALLESVRNLYRKGKNEVIRQCLFSNCLEIRNNKGIDSKEFRTALGNMGVYLSWGYAVAVYDVKFDQLLFEFLRYNKAAGTFDKFSCTARNAGLVLAILEKVMDRNNYEGRYMKFMWDLFTYFRNTNLDLANRIDEAVKDLTGQGIPTAVQGG